MNKYIFGKIGDSFFEVFLTEDEDVSAREGFILMKEERPGCNYIVKREGDYGIWVVDEQYYVKLNQPVINNLIADINKDIRAINDELDADINDEFDSYTDEQIKFLTDKKETLKKYRREIKALDLNTDNLVIPEKPEKPENDFDKNVHV